MLGRIFPVFKKPYVPTLSSTDPVYLQQLYDRLTLELNYALDPDSLEAIGNLRNLVCSELIDAKKE